MRISASNIGIVFSNTVRGISSSLLNAFVCFAFTALNRQFDLKSFIVFFTISNLLLIILNWGLKDYSVKLFAAENDSKSVFSRLFSLRLLLFFLAGSVVSLFPIDPNLLIFILVFSFFRSVNNTIESFSLLNNKNFSFAFVDLASLVILITAYFLHFNFGASAVFCLIISCEIIKMLLGFVLFYQQLSFHFISPLAFLKETKNYFLVAFFSFLLSKADFYISSFYLPSKALINYHIYSSLIGLSQVIITGFFSRQMVVWFKSKKEDLSVNIKWFSLVAFSLSLIALPFFYFITLYFYRFTVSGTMLVLVFFNLLLYSFLLLEIYRNTNQNKHRVILSGVLFSALINIILSFLLIQYYDTLGAILANIISLFVLYLYFKFIAHFHLKHVA